MIKRAIYRHLFRMFRLLRGPAVVRDELGNSILLDEHDSLGLFRAGAHESRERRLFCREIGRGDVVVEVGANIGYHTLLLSHLAGHEGRVFAFEPAPDNFRILCRNLAENNRRNVATVNMAVSDTDGAMKLHLSEHNSGMHRIYDSVCTGPTIEVPVVRLDGFLRDKADRVDLLKVDVEGWEYPVINGLGSYLRDNPTIKVFMEFSPASMTEAGLDPSVCLDFLNQEGFAIHRVEQNDTPPADVDELKAWAATVADITRRFALELKAGNRVLPPSRVAHELARFAARRHNYHGDISVDLFCSRPT